MLNGSSGKSQTDFVAWLKHPGAKGDKGIKVIRETKAIKAIKR